MTAQEIAREVEAIEAELHDLKHINDNGRYRSSISAE